jgi:hypothetical protein
MRARENQKRSKKKEKKKQETRNPEAPGASIGYHRVPNPQKLQLSPASASDSKNMNKETSAGNAATAG